MINKLLKMDSNFFEFIILLKWKFQIIILNLRYQIFCWERLEKYFCIVILVIYDLRELWCSQCSNHVKRIYTKCEVCFFQLKYNKVYIASLSIIHIIDMPLITSCYHIHAVITVGWYNIGLYISTPLLLQGLPQTNISPLLIDK